MHDHLRCSHRHLDHGPQVGWMRKVFVALKIVLIIMVEMRS